MSEPTQPDAPEIPDDDEPLSAARVGELLEMSDGDSSFLRELFGYFVEGTAERLSAIREAIRDGNPRCIAENAHSIKGGAANVGAVRVARLARELEQHASDPARPAELLPELEREYALAKDAILKIEKG